MSNRTSVTLRSQKIHSSPWHQRYYSVPPPTLEEELENAITQSISDQEIARTPSSSAVFNYVNDVRQQFKIVRFEFLEPAIEWIITHNYNTNIFQESIFDINNNRMIAPIEIIDNNSFKILLAEPLTGYVDVRF